MIKTMLVSALFRQFGRCFGLLTLQDKHNIFTLSEDINLICTRCETGQNNYIFFNNVWTCTCIYMQSIIIGR